MNPSTNCPKRPEERGRYLNLSPSFSEDPSSTPRGPGVEHSETALAFEVTIRALPSSMFTLLCPTAPSLVSLPPPGPHPGSPHPLEALGARLTDTSGVRSDSRAPRVNHCNLSSNCSLPSGFLGPARVPGARAEPGRGEVYFSADEHLPAACLSQDKSPAPFSLALSPLYKNNFISKEQITPSAHNRCQELFLF